MRACLLLCAALALAPSRPRAAAASSHKHGPHGSHGPHGLHGSHGSHGSHGPLEPHESHGPHEPHPAPEPARLEHIKIQILAKLGLAERPTPLGAPPRDVVRQILARAADERPDRPPEPEPSMREIIAIAHREFCCRCSSANGYDRINVYKCDLSCKGSSSGASFLNGHVYSYGVEGKVSVFLTGADKQETSVSIIGQVSISAEGNCALSLKVNSLAIAGPDGKKYPAPKGIEKVVRFNLQDGKVGPEICTEEGDNRSSLNIKRAIISLLQTELKPSTQTDVFGSCPTDVSSSKEGGSLLVHRTRDLSNCAFREQSKNELITAVYNPSSEIKSSQLLQSTLNVESKVNNGVPEKVSAVEQYLYKPFAVGDSGARAEVNTKLILTGTAKAGSLGGNCNIARTIIFENPHNDKANSDAKNVLNAVKATCKNLGSEAGFKSAGIFAQLVRILRTANKGDLLQVFEQIKSNNLERRVFLDALVRAGSGFSIEASIHILESKALSALEEKIVFLSLGNARHVSGDAIKAAAGLLDLPNLPNGVYLGVGALAGTYCRDHNCHTEQNGGIAELSKKLVSKLQNCKPKTKVEEDNVVAVLKGIRNIRHLENSLVDKLASCAADNNVKARVRVNALEAFHADPCASKIKKTALDIMKNRNLDSEIRIKAYLAVIDCPCGKSANEIKHLLESEPVHQVGRFITTSLRHIRSSANPDKNLARQHYGLIGIPNKYNIDDRKYSFYRELSYNVDAIGAGGNLEQTVIYSQDSFLPRSVSLNLTAEVFGHSVNILEVGGRQGNLDRVVEHFLGPRSFLRTQEPQEIYNNLYQKFQESYHKVEGSVRGRRSIKSEVDNFDKHVKAESMQYNNELDLDIYIKLFGTDAVFLSLGDDKGFDFNKFLDQSLSFMNEGFNKMKHFQQELRGHFLFMDTELAYPTSTGLPLKLDAVGSVTGRVDVSSAVDIRQCLRNPESAKVDIKLIPSSDVEISLVMLVDAHLVSTGLKVITNLHSSTGGHVIAKVIENGKGFDLQWGLPIEKQEILTASSDLVFFVAENGQFEKQTPIKNNNGDKKDYSGCFDQLSGVLGLTLCGKVSFSEFPGAFPLFGSSKVKLVLEKNDLKGYHIMGVVRNDPNGKYALGLLFDAEGSKNRRTQINAGAIYNAEEKSIELEVESPIKNIHAKYAILTKSSEYALVTLMKFDQNKYYGRIGLNIEGNNQRSVWKPVIEYEMPGQNEKKSLKVDGQIIKESNGPSVKYTLENVKVFLSDQNEMNIEGHLYQEPKGVEMDLKGRLGTQNVLLSGSLKGYDMKLEFQNTLNPYVNFKVNGHFENTEGINHNDIDLYYSGDLRDQQNRVIFNQLYKRHKSADGFNVITKNKFEICALPIRAKLDFEMDPKKFDIDVGGVYLDKKANFDLEARTHIKKPGDYRVKWTLNVDKQIVEALVKRDIVSSDKSNLENYIDFKNFFKYELSGVVLHRIKTNDVNIGAVGHLKITGSGKEEDIKFDVGAIENAHLYSSHATISNAKGELLDFLLKINIGNNANGQLKFNLKDAIMAEGRYQVTDKDGKGNGNIMVHFKKVERMIKGDVKFLVKAPVYNADIDLYLNFDKNKDDKMHFSTSNKFNEKVINSKNKFAYNGKDFELNLIKDGVLYGVGKGRYNLEVVLPDERCLNFKADREVTSKDDVLNGHAEAVLSDSPKRGQAGSSLKYKAKMVDTDFSKFHIDYDGQVEMNLKDGKNLVNTFSFKNIPKGEKYDMSFKDEISGNLLPHKVIIDASSVYTTDISNSDDTYRLKASYGDDLAAELTGLYQIFLPEKGEKKYIEDYTLNVRLPFEKAHDLKWVSNFQYLQPENEAVEVTFIQVFQVNADLYKLESSGKYGLKNGNTKLKFIVPHYDPIILDSDYKINDSKDKQSAELDLKAQYGKGKISTFKLNGVSAPKDIEIKFDLHSPDSENAKKLEVNLRAKNPSPDTYNSLISIDVDGRAYKSEGYVVYSNTQPVVDLKYNSPSNPKTSRLYFKGISMRSKEGRIDMKVENIKDFNLDSTLEANLEKDLYVKFQGNSEKLGLKNYKLDISSKDAGSGKRLEFHAINDNKNVLSGSTSYISKQEGQKTIIEGSGTVTIKDEQKPANFKYIRTILTEGNEQGIETFVNLAFGDRNHVVETRVTNIEYKTSYVYCEEKKQCAHAELNSKFVTAPDALKHLFNVGLDLRKLGLATEFGLQVANEFSDKKLPQYDLNLHVNKESDKYHFHVYSQPEHGKFPAGIVLSFPKRVIALESLIQYSTDKNLPFPVRGELSLYPDKNKPQTKTSARFSFDVNGNEKQGEASALIGFSHPRLGKEALVKFHGLMKRPNVNTLHIETSSVVSHSILGNDREAKFYLEVNPVHIKLMLDTPLVKVIDLEGSATVKENLQQADLKFSLLQGKPVTVYGVVKDFEYYEFTTGYSDESERKLSIISHLNPEKRVDISVDIVLPGQKKNIIHGALFLQDNLVKSDYGVSKENFNHFVGALKKDLENLKLRVQGLGDKASADFKNILQKIEPTFKQIEKAYKEDIEKMIKEIGNDKSLKEISEALHTLVKIAAKIIDDVVTVFKPIADNIVETITQISKKICDIYDKQIEPQFKQLYNAVAAVFEEYLNGIIDAVAHFSAIIIDFFERHKPELQELANVFTEIFKDLTRIVVAQLKEWRAKSSQFFSELAQQIKEMPVLGMIKEKWRELEIPVKAMSLLQGVHASVRPMLPTEETKQFLDALMHYAEKKINNKPCDESAELRLIFEKLVSAVTSLANLVRAQLGQVGLQQYIDVTEAHLLGASPLSLPSFRGSAALSFISQVLRGDVPDPWTLFKAYRPRSLNPLDEIPSKMRAMVVNGQHIFTFDGRHLTFPGSCRYVLAHDHVDRNFTLVIQLANGNPKALILEDKSGITIELKENGQVALNGASHGYPISEKEVFAFRQPNGRIGVGSLYGVMAICTSKLEVCYIEVSGFYLGKLRGLLGDGNNEPYDDFRLPNGKISNSESDFGNAYKLAGSCPAVKTPEHSHHQMHEALPPACEEVFGGLSPLRPLSLVLDIAPFRQACIHAVSGASEPLEQACDLGRAYVALAVTGLLPAALPAACVRCADAGAPRELGAVYDVKLPDKQADIIVSVELTKSNENNFREIVVPLVSQVIDSLKAKRISDVKVYLVGISSKMPYPILFDTDLKLKSAKVQFDDESRYNDIKPVRIHNSHIDTIVDQFVSYVNLIKNRLGLTNVMATYRSILDLPLRATAVKHYISSVGDKCIPQDLVLSILRSAAYGEVFKNLDLTHTLVANTPDFKIGGGKSVNQVVGFSEHSVLLLGDKKQKDTESLRETLKLEDEDACIDMSQNTGGLTLSASTFRACNPGQQKQWLQTAAASVVARLTQYNLVQSCTCSFVDPFRVRSVCVTKERKEAARRRK